MAEALIVPLIENLNSLIGRRIGLLLGVDKEMKRLSSLLSAISAVLDDAEERQLTDRAIKDWLRKLSDVSFELDDVLDDCEWVACEIQIRTWARKVRSSLSCLNPMNVLFQVKIANKMKEIGDRLDEIASERRNFHLRESVGEVRRAGRAGESRQTGSILNQPMNVYGREDDKEMVVGFLVNDAAKCKDVSVYAIVGLGGLGKTTLAQLVFNDERVSKHFEVKMWVCVSEDFDVKRLVKAIIESVSGSYCDPLDMDTLQRRLQELLKGKRFLLVLDDVWNEDQEEWDKLKNVLACGSSGSSIVVTTRLKKVASIMGTVPMHYLSGLSEDDCWSLFKQRAFGSDMEEHPNLVKIGKEIVKKCKGVPLAAKALGGLMCFKKEENEWLFVMQSELWNLPEDQLSILPALRLSYFHLPIEHRRCFAYCAIFPKDHILEKELLIQLWMANGLISSKGGLEVEDVGNEIFNELCWRSFILDEKVIHGDFSCFKMHDLVHDLAQTVMEDQCQYVNVGDDVSPINLSKRVRHLAYHDISGSKMRIEIIPSAKSLRTFLGLNKGSYNCSFDSKFLSLRAFDAKYMWPSKTISSLISDLKHLRYLNLSCSNIEILPESICSLHHLLTLDLSYCNAVRELPKRMSRLKRLRHLRIHGCRQMSHMPPNIGRLTSLKTLTCFAVSRRKGCQLNELCHLNIGGSLEIQNLEKLGSPTEAKSANLSGKRNLEKLYLYWNENGSQENVEQVLEALAPSPSLSILGIHNYKGIAFPYWLSNRILGNVNRIILFNCTNCVDLPPFGKMTLLRDLEIFKMNCVKFMDNQCYDGHLKRSFVQLKNLRLRDLPNLERLSREEGEEMFPCLSNLNVDNCPKLMLPSLKSVRKLTVFKVTDLLLESVANLCGLTHICLDYNDSMSSFPHGMLENLTSLQSLEIYGFTKLQEFPSDMLAGCNALERVDISFCHELKYLPEGIFQSSICLKHISIKSCKRLKSLSEVLQDLTALESLKLVDCPELDVFPTSLSHLSSLRNLGVSGLDLDMNKSGGCGYSYSNRASHELVHLPEAFQHIPSLESMTISYFKEFASLPDWIGNLESLRELRFIGCPDLAHIPMSIKQLTNLRELVIETCPKLEEQCQGEVGEDWHKIAHIPIVYVGPEKLSFEPW